MVKKLKIECALLLFCLRSGVESSAKLMILMSISGIMSYIFPILINIQMKEILDCLVQLNSGMGRIKAVIIVFCLLNIFKLIVFRVHDYSKMLIQDLTVNRLREQVAKLSSDVALEELDKPSFYDNIKQTTNNIYSVTNGLIGGLDIAGCLVSFVTCFWLLCTYDAFITILLAASTIPFGIIEYSYTKSVYLWDVDHIRDLRKMDYLCNVLMDRRFAMEIRLRNLSKFFEQKYLKLWTDFFLKKEKIILSKATWNVILSIFPEAVICLGLFFLGRKVYMHDITVGEFSMCSGLLIEVDMRLTALIMSMFGLLENKKKIEYVYNFFNKEEKKQIGSNPEIICNSITSIVFENVTFVYPNTNKVVLDGVSFTIIKGQHIGLVGINGAGKSTIVKLIMGFYQPTCGKILINGEEIKKYNVHSLRKELSCYFQDQKNFAFSIYDNIRICDLTNVKSDKAEQIVFSASGVDKIISSLEDGGNTICSKEYDETGMVFSNGQEQKIALCRSLYADSSVLVLDEPTSFMDVESEENLYKYIWDSDRIIIMISHRLSYVSLMDKILVLNKGKIVAEGNHNELLQGSSEYREMYLKQANGYK